MWSYRFAWGERSRDNNGEALAKYGRPEIVNTDLGGQFATTALTDAVLSRDISLSMDGKAAWRNEVFVEHVAKRQI
ncbi:hypothetical protein LJR034_005337 [Caballeronia sp. LjRoot34]|uniref:hypothetical protein n=1 Tax=Caballeronia sp. LjRoot34 TaxID=3342325 RepID=UPI003ED157A5